MKHTNLLLFFSLISYSLFGQFAMLPDQEAKKQQTHTSLIKALDYPEQIYKLDLFGSLDYAQVPEDIGELFNLQVLLLGKNQIQKLPRSFIRLRKLEHLDLGQNPDLNFEDAWEKLKKLKKLNILFLNRTNLKYIPEDFNDLNQLRWLNLEGNPKLDLEKSIPILSSIPTLKVLNLSWGEYEELPASIGMLAELEELFLNDNTLKTIPKELYKLKQLRTLDLTANPLPQKEVDALRAALANTKIYF